MIIGILLAILVVALAALFLGISFLTALFVTKVPFISSGKKDFRASVEAADLKPGDLLFDLGCGKAHHLIYADKKMGAKCVGYELSLWPYLWAKFNIWLSHSDAKVYFKDFYKADISKADVIYCYLFPEIMDKLESKFKAEMKPGSRVVSYGFKISKMTPAKEVITNQKNPGLGVIRVYQF